MLFSTLGPTARSRSGQTRMVSRFLKVPSVMNFSPLHASTALLSLATTCLALLQAPMVLLLPRQATSMPKPPMDSPATPTGSRLSWVSLLVMRPAPAALAALPPTVHRLLQDLFPPPPTLPQSLRLAPHLLPPSPLRRVTMPLLRAPGKQPIVSRMSCKRVLRIIEER